VTAVNRLAIAAAAVLLFWAGLAYNLTRPADASDYLRIALQAAASAHDGAGTGVLIGRQQLDQQVFGAFVVSAYEDALLVSILVGAAVLMTTIDPIQLTEYTLVFSAVALPLTYLPILVVANDRGYLGNRVNGRLANALGTAYLFIVGAAAVAAIPLMLLTRMGGG
jgi:hypothetical protein